MSGKLAEAIQERFPAFVQGISVQPRDGGQWRVDIHKDGIVPILAYAKEALGLAYLADITAVDYLTMPQAPAERFGLVYVLRGLEENTVLVVRARVPESDAEVDSITSLWKAADWLEREIFDLFGIVFRNHPNLLRILMPENFDAHPLRKDFPTTGVGYRDGFPIVTR